MSGNAFAAGNTASTLQAQGQKRGWHTWRRKHGGARVRRADERGDDHRQGRQGRQSAHVHRHPTTQPGMREVKIKAKRLRLRLYATTRSRD
jgi:hypothetical protein